ncbi:MAG TPA: mucoidy inhibitor MuiA family protein [bacterium (Candidatus Stahlbacteria)]|nr:mucoidy inhibitor MuiA family protein [Candidatus Stahlbacteria bacterium]
MLFLLVATVTSNVVSATFYPDRILVREIATVTLSGPERIEVSNLPGGMNRTTFRISGKGVKIGEVSLDQIYLIEERDPKVRRLIQRIDSLEEKKTALEDEIEALKAKENFLRSIQLAMPEKFSKEIYQGKVALSEWQKAMDFIFTGGVEVKASIRKKKRLNEKLNEKLDQLRKRLRKIAPYHRKRSYTATVEVIPEGPGDYRLRLEYLMTGGGWRPYYEFRPVGDHLEIGVFATLLQKSGRDFNDVRITLTTARPSVGPSPPELSAWRLGFYKPRHMAPLAIAKRPEEVDVEEAGPVVNLKPPGLLTVKTGEEKKIPIETEEFPARMFHYAVPRVSPSVYLKIETENGFDFPLLAGSGSTYLGGIYTGSTHLDHTAPGESLKIFIGPDEKVKVRRELVRRFKKTKGLFKKREAVAYHYRITVENYRKNKINLVLKDQIPVSTESEIEVKDIKITPEAKPDEKGIITWSVGLGGNEKEEFNIEFVVEYPKGRKVKGIL